MTAARAQIDGVQVIRHSKTILDVEHLAVHPGEIVAVVGPNGAGKSTLVRVIGLLLRPERGEVTLSGERITKKREYSARRKLACVFQSPHLLETTVFANVELGLRLRGVPKNERKKRVARWLEALGIQELAGRRARTLSGGEAQRVNLARALALKPELLLLDEPLGGLDTPTRHALIDELGPLVRRGAGAGLLVTHDRRVALALGDRVVVMLRGRVRQIGPPEEVFAKPIDEEIARFVGVENLMPAHATGQTIKFSGGETVRRADGPEGAVTVCLRAEEIRISTGNFENNGFDEPNTLKGTVARIHRHGVGFACEIDVGPILVCQLSRARLEILGIEPGAPITARIRPEAFHTVPRRSSNGDKPR